MTLKTKLILSIAVPLLFAYGVMLWWEYSLDRANAFADMEEYLTGAAARGAAELNGDLAGAEELARTAALAVALNPDFSDKQLDTLITESLTSNLKVYGMAVALQPSEGSGEGRRHATYCHRSSDGLKCVDLAAKVPGYTNRPWYGDAKTSGRPVWTEPYQGEAADETFMCTYSVPVRTGEGITGVVAVDVRSEELLKRFDDLELGAAHLMLISRKGRFIAHPDASLSMDESVFSLAKRFKIDELAAAGRQIAEGRAGIVRIRDYRTNAPEWMVFAPVESTGWSLAAAIPEGEVMAPIHSRLVRSLGILIAGLIVIVGIVFFVAIHVTRPVARLAEAAESLGHGNLDARVAGVEGNDEIAQLARRFNAMTAELKENVDGRIREESARKEVEGELKAAREIQASLLPEMLPQDRQTSFLLHAVNAPAKMVAGDFFDFFFIDDNRLAVVMADVAGKGIPAALYMAVARTKLRDFAMPEKTPSQIVDNLNRCLAEQNDRAMFLSLFFGLYDVQSGELVYVNAGHNPPYLIRGGRRLETLEPTGPLVAVFPEAEYREGRCRLDPDDLLFVFTDGVTEAHEGTHELFGEERLERLLQSFAADLPASCCEVIVKTVTDFSLGDLKDDVTVLALRCAKPVSTGADSAQTGDEHAVLGGAS